MTNKARTCFQSPVMNVTREFTITARRWWQNIRDDSEDTTPVSILTVRNAKLLRYLRRLKKRTSLRIQNRAKYGRNKLAIKKKRKPLSRYSSICVKFWLHRWRTARLMLIRIKQDRSWARILETTRSWRRYKFTIPYFRQWRAHVATFCRSRSACLAARRSITTKHSRRRLLSAIRFWHVYSKHTRGVKKACFRMLRFHRSLVPLVLLWARLREREGFGRWRRRSRWPKILQFHKSARIPPLLRLWTRFVLHSKRMAAVELISRKSILSTLMSRWRRRTHATTTITTAATISHSFYRAKMLCFMLVRWSHRARVLGGLAAVRRTSVSYFRNRQLFHAWIHIFRVTQLARKRGLVLAGMHGEEYHGRAMSHSALLAAMHNGRARKKSIFQTWQSRARLKTRVTSCGELFILSQRLERACFNTLGRLVRHSRATRVLDSELDKTYLGKALARFASSCAIKSMQTLRMRVGREHIARRLVPRGFRRWRQVAVLQQQLRNIVFYLRRKKFIRVWAIVAAQSVQTSISYHRGILRYSTRSLRIALMYIHKATARTRQLKRISKVFRRLHPYPRCSCVAKVFRAWARLVLIQTSRRHAFKIVARHRKLRISAVLFEHWHDVFLKSTSLAATIKQRALQRWNKRRTNNLHCYSLLQRYIVARGLRRNVNGSAIASTFPVDGEHVNVQRWCLQRHNGYAVSTAAGQFIVAMAMKCNSLSRFRMYCLLRRVIAQWRTNAVQSLRESIILHSTRHFCITRTAALAIALSRVDPHRISFMLRLYWSQWAVQHHRRKQCQKRRAQLACILKPMLRYWKAAFELSLVRRHIHSARNYR